MPVLLITYDQIKTDCAIDQVPGFIKRYNYIQLSECTYAIETYEKTRTVFNKITSLLGKSSHLLVITLIKPFSGVTMAPTSEWFSKHLTEE